MEEKKEPIKISLTVALLVFAIIVICIIGFFMYNINTDKNDADVKISKLENQVSSLQSDLNETKNELISSTQHRDNNVSNILLTEKAENKNINEFFTTIYLNDNNELYILVDKR